MARTRAPDLHSKAFTRRLSVLIDLYYTLGTCWLGRETVRIIHGSQSDNSHSQSVCLPSWLWHMSLPCKDVSFSSLSNIQCQRGKALKPHKRSQAAAGPQVVLVMGPDPALWRLLPECSGPIVIIILIKKKVHHSAILGLMPTDLERAKNYPSKAQHSYHRDVSLFQFIDGVD